jgi:hypothetical protein
MQKSNSVFLKTQLTKFLSEIGVEMFFTENPEKLEYIIEYDSEERQESKTNSDDIMKHWVLPKKIGERQSLNDACDSLTTHKNELPLWIKLTLTENSNVIKLLISKRFRKMRVIEEWHISNEYKPITKTIPSKF